MIAEAIRLLRDLGQSPRAVAHHLEQLGIKGKRNNCYVCPLTVLLNREVPTSGYFLVFKNVVQWWPTLVCPDQTAVLTEPLPSACEDFDNREFPELETKEKEV